MFQVWRHDVIVFPAAPRWRGRNAVNHSRSGRRRSARRSKRASSPARSPVTGTRRSLFRLERSIITTAFSVSTSRRRRRRASGGRSPAPRISRKMTGIVYSRNGLRYSGAMESAARKKAASSSSVNMCGRLLAGQGEVAAGGIDAGMAQDLGIQLGANQGRVRMVQVVEYPQGGGPGPARGTEVAAAEVHIAQAAEEAGPKAAAPARQPPFSE